MLIAAMYALMVFLPAQQPAGDAGPAGAEALWNSALALYNNADYAGAQSRLRSLLAAEPASGRVHALLGLCHFELKDYAAAQLHLQQGRALGIPAETKLEQPVLLHLSESFLADRKYEAALALLLGPRVRGNLSPDHMLAAGLAALRIGMVLKQARTELRLEMLEIAARVGLAHYHAAHSQMDQAGAIFTALFEAHPKLRNLHHAWGSLLIGASRWDAAATEFRDELVLDPESVPARLGLAFVDLRQDGGTEAGLRWAREACERQPKSFNARFLLGSVLLALEQPEAAVKELEQARDLDPASPIARFTLARAYRAVRRTDDANREMDAFERLKALQQMLQGRGRELEHSQPQK